MSSRVFQVVMDTNVLIAALRSGRGASHRLVMLIGDGRWQMNLSVPLVLEYEEVAKRLLPGLDLAEEDIDDILDYICSKANLREIFYLWRPLLRDPKDDMVLELAVESQSDFIVTYNARDFAAAKSFGIEILTARQFLQRLGEIP